MKITAEQINEAEEQIINQKKPVAFDTREYPVEVLIEKFEQGEFIVPAYQRAFVWEKDKEKMSKFIESILLDLPIPYLFFADDITSGKLEIVDGSQRLRTITSFKNNEFKLSHLDVLHLLNGFTFKDLVESRQRRFLRKTLRSIELTEKASPNVRRDLFERINTKPYDLLPMEIRKGIYSDTEFFKFLDKCSKDKRFIELCPITKDRIGRGETQELILRFFAYSENYTNFVHSVEDFLDDYMKEKKENGFDEAEYWEQFERMLVFVKNNFPDGFRKKANFKTVSRVRFEAIAVGSSLALKDRPMLIPKNIDTWLNSKEFDEHTTSGSANNKSKVIGRINYVRDRLVENV